MTRQPFIIAADLSDTRALVVGGGPVGLRKAQRLLSAGARVRLVCPHPIELAHEALEHIQRPFRDSDLDGCALVFACTNDHDLNAHTARMSAQRGLWCNSATQPKEGNFHVLASSPLGDLQIAIGSGGAAPGVSRALKQRLESTLGPEWARLAELTRDARAALMQSVPRADERTKRLRAWLNRPLIRWLATDDRAALERASLRHLGHAPSPSPNPSGRPTILFSGFGPFPNVPDNPSPKVARAAAGLLAERFPEAHIVTVELPTHFDAGWHALRDHIERLRTDPDTHLAAILPLGVASRATEVRLERIAINHRLGGIMDASGRSASEHGEPLDPWGADGLFARMDVDRIVAEIAGAGHKIVSSESAGTYVCNEVFYKLIAHCHREGIDARAGFIHIPPVPEVMTTREAARIVAQIAEKAIRPGR